MVVPCRECPERWRRRCRLEDVQLRQPAATMTVSLYRLALSCAAHVEDEIRAEIVDAEIGEEARDIDDDGQRILIE